MSDFGVTLLLGAGFSKEICRDFPTMNELTKIVFADEELSLQVRAIDRQLSLFRDKELDEVNIEEWFQILEESEAYFKDPKVADRRKLMVRIALQVISSYIQQISSNLTFTPEQLDKFEVLINARVNIITTNYDLIFEKAIAELISHKRIQIGTPYDLHVGQIEMAHQRYAGTYLSAGQIDKTKYSRIFKLHGSCDWYTPEVESSERIYADGSLISNFLREETRMASRQACENMSPLIAGPTSKKSTLINSKSMNPIWVSAYSALRNTSRLFVYGSSLHVSDAALNSLIIEGLPASVGAHIYDRDPKRVLERLNKLTDNAQNHLIPPDRVSFSHLVQMVSDYQDSSHV